MREHVQDGSRADGAKVASGVLLEAVAIAMLIVALVLYSRSAQGIHEEYADRNAAIEETERQAE